MKHFIKNYLFVGLVVFVLLISVVFISFYLNKPPKVVLKNAPSDVFSAERAMEYLPNIANKPHPMGTAEHLKVRNYLIDELKKLGTTPELQITEVYNPNTKTAGSVVNIIVKISGTDNSKAILVLGHYDSTEFSFGGSDDGSAIVTLLETLRAVKAMSPLKNDVVFLISDGEELGLLGAKAFIDQHPLAKEIGLVLNFEATGTSGPSMMFETSKDNYWLISEFAKAAPYPVANSLSVEVYKKMPNGTDLTTFINVGIKGLNFAYLDDRYNYHNYGDNIKNTSPESVQHNGSYALSLVRHFGNIDISKTTKGDAVYFNTIGSGFVYYSYKWVIPFAVITFLAFVVLLILGFKRKIIKPLRVLFGFFAFVIHLLIAPAIITCLFYILSKFYPGNDYRLLFYNYRPLLLGFVGIAIAISFTYFKLLSKGIKIWQALTLLILVLILLLASDNLNIVTSLVTVVTCAVLYFLFHKPTNIWELTTGFLTGWTILMFASCIAMPGVSYLFTWPFLFSLIPLLIYFVKKNQANFSVLEIGLFVIFAVPALLWFSQLTHIFLLAMGLSMAGAAIMFTLLCLSLLIPHIEIITKDKPWIIPICAFIFGLFFTLKGSVNLEYTENCKKLNSLIYAVNGETGETFITTYEKTADEWTKNFLSEKPDTCRMLDFFPFDKSVYIKKTINADPLPSPDCTILKDSIIGEKRCLDLHLESKRKANNLYVFIKTDTKVTEMGLNNSKLSELKPIRNTDWHYIGYFALPTSGIDLKLNIEKDKKVEIRLIDYNAGVPDSLINTFKPRPDYMAPFGDKTIVLKKFIF